ncbi:hypothetical protein NDU88_001078 [Pleurodeles waltl]|uniref:Uncharacterized protein n=1 Tax=Pleurodeles waltl TaxID=8319 RepID=A0AAV7MK04_PLEWA|nr:hypothetical protein NDU88_001078 [Pleurodeles waltl]
MGTSLWNPHDPTEPPRTPGIGGDAEVGATVHLPRVLGIQTADKGMGHTKTTIEKQVLHSRCILLDNSLTQAPEDYAPPTNGTPQVDNLDIIFQKIQLRAITTDNSLLKDDQLKLADKVRTNKQTLTTLAPCQGQHSAQLTQLCRHNCADCAEQLQNCMDDVQEQCPDSGTLRTVVAPSGLCKPFVVERAHWPP